MKLEWRLSQFLARASAYVIDVLLTAAIVLPTQGVLFWTRLNPVVDDPTATKVHLWVMATVTVPVLLYFVATTRLFGATLGKSILKLQTTAADGESPLPLPRIVLRYMIVLAPFELNHIAMASEAWPAFIGVYVAGLVLGGSVLLQPEGRGLHDLAVGSRVVRRHVHSE